jgi:hypothetical protein
MKSMRLVSLVAAAGLLAAPAVANTLEEVTKNGVLITVGGVPYDIAYNADGTFAEATGQFAGTWKVDGDNLCITIPGLVENQCTLYPKDKKSGDEFEVASDMGPMLVKIK